MMRGFLKALLWVVVGIGLLFGTCVLMIATR